MKGTTAYDGACECGGLIEAAPAPRRAGSALRTVNYDRVALRVASRLAACWQDDNALYPELHRRRDPTLEEALRHEKAIDAILKEPAGWWTGSDLADTKGTDRDKPQATAAIPCAFCCRPAGDDGLCGECRYEHGE
jgi:hypothetical protein